MDRKLISVDPLQFMDRKPYRERLIEARRQTGLREAVTTGYCRIGGRRVVLAVFDFGFLGGTMGSVVGEKVANAFEHATRRRVPMVSVVASGGARMQEGMLSLMQMAKVSAAAARHDTEGLAFISILTDPTFGGVTASFASLGDVIIAEPGAQIGFVGPRVIEQTTGTPPPPDSHRAETVLRAGMIDLIVPRDRLRETVAYLVGHLSGGKRAGGAPSKISSAPRPRALAAWEQVRLARLSARPQSRDYIDAMTARFVELHGDRQGGDDPAIVGGLAELDGETVVIVGHQRGHSPEEASSLLFDFEPDELEGVVLVVLERRQGIPRHGQRRTAFDAMFEPNHRRWRATSRQCPACPLRSCPLSSAKGGAAARWPSAWRIGC